MIGFTDIEDINNELLKLEQGTEHPQIANHVLTIMVRGILFKMEFPLYALEQEVLLPSIPLCGKQV